MIKNIKESHFAKVGYNKAEPTEICKSVRDIELRATDSYDRELGNAMSLNAMALSTHKGSSKEKGKEKTSKAPKKKATRVKRKRADSKGMSEKKDKENKEKNGKKDKDDNRAKRKKSNDEEVEKKDEIINLLFSNVSGKLSDQKKFEALKSRAIGEQILCFNEMNCKKDAPLLVKKELGIKAIIKYLDRVRYSTSGNRIEIPKNEPSKRSGYGTAIISKSAGLIEDVYISDRFEIIISRLTRDDKRGLIIIIII
jgi:hypothetical protein